MQPVRGRTRQCQQRNGCYGSSQVVALRHSPPHSKPRYTTPSYPGSALEHRLPCQLSKTVMLMHTCQHSSVCQSEVPHQAMPPWLHLHCGHLQHVQRQQAQPAQALMLQRGRTQALVCTLSLFWLLLAEPLSSLLCVVLDLLLQRLGGQCCCQGLITLSLFLTYAKHTFTMRCLRISVLHGCTTPVLTFSSLSRHMQPGCGHSIYIERIHLQVS